MASTLPKPTPQPPAKLVRVATPVEQEEAMDVDQPAAEASPVGGPEEGPADAAPTHTPEPAATPAAPVDAQPAGATPWRTPQPLAAEVATPATAAPAPGWQQLYQAGNDGVQEDVHVVGRACCCHRPREPCAGRGSKPGGAVDAAGIRRRALGRPALFLPRRARGAQQPRHRLPVWQGKCMLSHVRHARLSITEWLVIHAL